MAQSKARNSVFKLNAIVCVTEPTFGAKGDGTTDDTAAFQAAIDSVSSGQAITVEVPRGTYLLSSGVTENGRVVSWDIDSAATFTGAGSLPSINIGHFGDQRYYNAGAVLQRGTSGTPNTSKSPLGLLKKVSSAATSGDESNAVFVVMGERRTTTTSGTRLQGFWSEVEDYAGGSGTFVEGGRFGSTLESGSDGSSYGVIALAGCEAAVTSFDYLIANEGAVSNNKTDAPATDSFSTAQFSACFIATTHFGTKHVDAAFICNPFNNTGGSVAMPRAGFFVPANSVKSDGRAFVNQAAVDVGLDLRLGTYATAAILLGNDGASLVRARNAANSANHNIFYYNSSNQVVIGADAVSVKLQCVDNAVANPLLRDIVYGAAGSGSRGAGFRALQVPN